MASSSEQPGDSWEEATRHANENIDLVHEMTTKFEKARGEANEKRSRVKSPPLGTIFKEIPDGLEAARVLVDRHRRRAEEQSSQLISQSDKISELERRVDWRDASLSDLKKQIKDQSKTLQRQINSRDNRIIELTEQNNALQEQVNSRDTRINELTEQNTILQKQLEESEETRKQGQAQAEVISTLHSTSYEVLQQREKLQNHLSIQREKFRSQLHEVRESLETTQLTGSSGAPVDTDETLEHDTHERESLDVEADTGEHEAFFRRPALPSVEDRESTQVHSRPSTSGSTGAGSRPPVEGTEFSTSEKGKRRRVDPSLPIQPEAGGSTTVQTPVAFGSTQTPAGSSSQSPAQTQSQSTTASGTAQTFTAGGSGQTTAGPSTALQSSPQEASKKAGRPLKKGFSHTRAKARVTETAPFAAELVFLVPTGVDGNSSRYERMDSLQDKSLVKAIVDTMKGFRNRDFIAFSETESLKCFGCLKVSKCTTPWLEGFARRRACGDCIQKKRPCVIMVMDGDEPLMVVLPIEDRYRDHQWTDLATYVRQ